MDNFGFIHDKLDIKILILYVLRRLPAEIGSSALAELVLFDDGIGYFDYTECLVELADTGHIAEENRSYRITEKGERNCEAVESSLPYSVRMKAEEKLEPIVSAMRRSAMIKASHTSSSDGGCMVNLSMSDGVGEIIALSLLASDKEQAEMIETNFRSDAEGYYNRIIELLTAETNVD